LSGSAPCSSSALLDDHDVETATATIYAHTLLAPAG
jgi:hypothetical protein